MENTALTVFLYILGVISALFILHLLARPIKFCFKLIWRTALGFLTLIVLNSFSHFSGISIAVNTFTSAVSGILGIPGTALLCALKVLL